MSESASFPNAESERHLSDPLIGLLIDERYRVKARIARGGMATVYLADDERLDRPVALKVMHPHLADSQDFVDRFRREARSAARIVHPGVVSVFDQGVIAGQGYLVMELIEGVNLRNHLLRVGAVTIGQALTWTNDIIQALGAAHNMGVIHRDIKPENILVTTGSELRLTDFGLARAASEVSQLSTASMLGTVAYVAPEVVTKGQCDARTDFYSVGVVLYELLTGRVPWADEGPIQMAMLHANEEIPPPSRSEQWIPTEIDDLVACLAALDPASRPSSAAEASRLVSRTLASLPQEILDRHAEVTPAAQSASTEYVATVEQTSVLSPTPEREESPVNANAYSSEGSNTSVSPAPSNEALAASSGKGTVAAPAHASPSQHKNRSRRILAWLLGITVFLALAASASYYWWIEFGPGSYREVPSVAGQSLDEAQATFAAIPLTTEVVEEFHDTVPQGTVIDSDPTGGTSVHKSTRIILRVSKGVDMRAVPDLSTMTAEEAQEALTQAGLALGAVEESWSESVAKGLVISQSVAAEEMVIHDSPVDITVSKGREPLTVPNVVGSELAAARESIEGLGLAVEATEEFSDSVAAGVVISQATEAGSTLYRGDTVAVVVSKGPELFAVPDVFGQQEGAARTALENAGFVVEVNRIFGGVFGTVRSTDPAAGTMLPKGSTVTLSVV